MKNGLSIRGIARVIIKDTGISKPHVASLLWGAAIGLLRNWDDSVVDKLHSLWFTSTLILTVYAIIGVIRQHLRHKRLNLEWKVLRAKANLAIEKDDYEELDRQVQAMNRLLEENFGVEIQKPLTR